MPLKLTKRKGSPYFYVRGTIKGEYIYESTGETGRAAADLIRIDREGALSRKKRGEKTFLDAAVAYLESGGEKRFVKKITDAIGHIPLGQCNQALFERESLRLYPDIRPVSRRRQFWDPAVGIMNKAARLEWVERKLFDKPTFKRPAPVWAELDWFKAFWLECRLQNEDELLTITILLPYTGMRISEILSLSWSQISIKDSQAYLPKTKNSEDRSVHLTVACVDALINIKRGNGRVFQYKDRTAVNKAIRRIVKAINAKRQGKEPLPYLSTHKIGSHTYATWMRRYAGMDDLELVATGRWKDRASTHHYTHTVVSKAAKKSDLLPTALAQNQDITALTD